MFKTPNFPPCFNGIWWVVLVILVVVVVMVVTVICFSQFKDRYICGLEGGKLA